MMLQNMRNTLVIVIAMIALLLNACKEDYSSVSYLQDVLSNVEAIESASYKLTGENWYPGDTTPLGIRSTLVKEYDNPSDKTIGAKFVQLNYSDTTITEFCYDGEMRALINNDENFIVLDSFRLIPRPFRALTPPFFNYAKSILRYALTTNDSVSLVINDQKDAVYMKMTIFEAHQVEFFGKAYYMPITPYTFDDNTSQYELWISKSDNLPYKIRRAMSHNISVTICEDYILNESDIKDFHASDYFAEGYQIQSYSARGSKKQPSMLIGRKAPTWSLQTADKTILSLDDLKSKVAMIQFTSVSCGPCKASIPFLKSLPEKYSKSDFDFVAVECASSNTNNLKHYMQQNDFEYEFLLSNKEVLKSYSISSYPVFFILDENRIISDVLFGYGKESTDEKITNIIDEMIL